MTPDWGSAPWSVSHPPALGSLPACVDALVVGGGLTGLSTARALARRGVEVVVAEATAIGAGASGRTGGLVLEGTAAGPLEGVSDCLPFLARLVADERIACDLDLRGCWEVTHRRRGRDDARAALRWRDGNSDVVVTDVIPGGTVEVGALVSGLAESARRAGAMIHEHARVLGLAADNPVRVTVQVEDGERIVEADHVVVALNAYTRTLVPLADDVVPALTMALATAPLDEGTLDAIGLAARLPFYTADLPYLWGRALYDDRLVFGAGLAFDPEHRIDRMSITTGEAADALARLEARVRGLHPALASVAIERRWAGPIAFRTGWKPLLARHPESPNVLVAGGYSGHGVALSVRVGELIAAAIAGERELPDWGAFAG